MKRAKNKNSMVLENRTGGKFPAKRFLMPIFVAMIFLGSLLMVVTLFSENAEAGSYGVQVSVVP
ncbi:MAG: hypothetical protein V3U20_10795, partial [Thermoplasmata archaeon]